MLGGLTFAHLLGGELLAARLQAQRLAHLATTQDMRLNKAWSQYFLGCTYLHAAELPNAADQFEHAATARYLLEPPAALDALAGLKNAGLLEFPDPLLLAWLMGRAVPADRDVAHIVRIIRNTTAA